ncbi:hypothetical protein HK098_007926 [Nowakowskiella sp. JEL0407]|nr:hypothetical protein HK098_007926 [Nowakowskiella sp. JEL0407]
MGDAKVFVGWNYGPLNNTSTTVSDRTSNSHRVPTTDTTSTLLIINNKTIADNFMTIPTHNTRIVFARSRAPPTTDSSKTKTLNLNGTTKFVYAYSNKPPVDPTQQTSSFFKHDVAGCFEADFLNPSNATRIGKEINCTTVGGTPNASYPAPISGIVNTGPSISKIYVANFSAYVNLQATNSVPFRISAGLIVGILGGIIACIILVMIYYYTRKKSRSFWVLE